MNRREVLTSLFALPTIGRISRLEIRPTDTIVVECPGAISFDQAINLRARLQTVFPGQTVIVLTEGTTLRVVEVR